MQLAVELADRTGMQREDVPPLLHERSLGLLRRHDRTLAEKTHFVASELNALAFNACACTVLLMTSPLNVPVAQERWSPRLWGTLLVLCAAMFLDALDVSMVGVALPSIGDRSRPVHLDPAVDRQRLHPRIRRPAAARRPRRRPARPAPGLPDRARRLRARLAARRTRRLRSAADRQPLHQGSERRVHRARRALHHHHDLQGRPAAQPRAGHLHHLRRHRLLHGPGPVRAAHRGELAPDHAAARAHRPDRAAGRPQADPAEQP